MQFYCQPIVPLRTMDRSLQSADVVPFAMARGDVLLRDDLPPVADHLQFTPQVDRQVIDGVCRWLESRSRSWVDLDYVTVKLNARSLADCELTEWILARLDRGHFDPRRLCVAVTESAAMQQMDRACEFLSQVRATGCHIALDDFGAGGAPLARFEALPIDVVRLDGSFVARIVEDAAARELVCWIGDLCHAFGRRTVAKHCDTPDTLAVVRRLGLDDAQGLAVCEPFPLDQLLPAVAPTLTLPYGPGSLTARTH
jgi:EAL domain-containing protein (putative c-di-GMP-specific phosphodiesterase class I)